MNSYWANHNYYVIIENSLEFFPSPAHTHKHRARESKQNYMWLCVFIKSIIIITDYLTQWNFYTSRNVKWWLLYYNECIKNEECTTSVWHMIPCSKSRVKPISSQ